MAFLKKYIKKKLIMFKK